MEGGVMTSRLGQIVVPVDGSAASADAVGLAIELAASCAGRIIFCHVLDTRDLYDKAATYGYDPRPLLAKMRSDAEDIFEPFVEAAAAHGVESQGVVVEGRPVDAILTAAAGRAADLIVMGTHGRRGLQRLFLGSTTEGVLRATDVPVLVVREHKRAPTRFQRPTNGRKQI
jgi:nucleotide-binding universal stress UspA family protein